MARIEKILVGSIAWCVVLALVIGAIIDNAVVIIVILQLVQLVVLLFILLFVMSIVIIVMSLREFFLDEDGRVHQSIEAAMQLLRQIWRGEKDDELYG